ncbi:MAG: hypothetical protein H7A33_08225 [Deltaproteobacteria bacterium]|nr:hypothetical protein [Deltaproteobacteria bacterium]
MNKAQGSSMNQFKKHTFMLLMTMACMLFASSAMAQALAQRNSPRMMQGVRAQGMGNAFIAVDGTDENAIFYNPAAINDYENKFHFQFLLPTAEFSYKAINFFASDITDLADDIDGAANDAAKINAFDTFAANNTGRYEEVDVRGSAVIMMHKYITASLFYESAGVIALTNPILSTVDIETVSQAGLMVGSAYSFFDDHLQVGGAVKFIERHMIDETLTNRDIVANNDFGDALDTKQFGFGVGFDIGLKGKLPCEGVKFCDVMDPRLAITLQDIGDTRFFAGDDVGRQQQSLSAGFAFNPKFWKLESTLAVDVRDLDHRTDFLNKFHAGAEVRWPEISKILREVSVRLGVNQIYLAAGLGLDFKYFKLNFATYGRDIGSKTIQKQSRMFSFQLAAGF